MILTAVLLIPAVGFGLLRGGSLRSLAETRIRWLPLIFVGLLGQLALLFLVEDPQEVVAGAALVASSAAIAVVLWLNRDLPGARVALVGTALNMVVIGLNGGMPIAQSAADIANIQQPLNEIDVEHELLDENTRLGFLGDVIPFPRLQMVVSIGDCLLAFGIARLAYCRTRADQPSKSEAEISHV